MFGLRNELFGFPVNDCELEHIDCKKSYIPILNWDKENEFTWSLGDPYGTEIDANNVTFNTRSPEFGPEITSVARALEELMRRINEKDVPCKFDLTGYSLTPDLEGNITGRIDYLDRNGEPQFLEASFNIKEVLANLDSLELKDLTVDTLTVKEKFNSNGDAEFNGKNDFNTAIDAHDDLNVEGKTNTNGITNTGDIITDTETVNEKLEVLGDTITNGIENTGKITTDDLETKTLEVTEKATIEDEEVNTSHIADATIDKATIEEEEVAKSHIVDLTAEDAVINNNLEVKGKTTTNGIKNTGDIETDSLKSTLAEFDNMKTNTATVKDRLLVEGDTRLKGDLKVDGRTDVNELEVNGEALFRDNVEMKDDLKVNGNTKLNGDVIINGDSQFNGSEHHDGDVEIEGNLTVKGSFDVGSIEVTGYQKLTEKGMPSGYTPLDSTGKVPSQFLPDMGQGGMAFQGGWNAGTGRYPQGANIGDLYYVTNGGTVGGIEYHVGDRIVMQDGGTRFRMEDTGGVTSVNNRVGDVIGLEENTNKVIAINKTVQSDTYYPSEKAVYDYINPIEETVKDLKETMDEWTSKEAVFEGDVVIGGDTVIEEGLTVKENVIIEKDLEVDGDATIKGDETVEGNTTIKGTTTMEDNVTMNKDLTVQGNETLAGTLTVTDKVTANGGLDVTGGTKTDTLEVTGDSTLDGGLTVVGESTFNDNVQMDGDLNVDGDTTLNNVEVKGELTLDDDLLVKGTLTVNGETTLNADVQIDTNLNVDGIITGEVKYDNGESGLEAENVQDAIDELENNKWQKPLFAKPEGFALFAEGDDVVAPQIKVTTPYIDKEKKTLNVWDGEEWIDIGGGSGNSDIVYLTMEEYEALSPEEKADPNKNYAIYINGEGGDTYLATADQIAFDKSGTDLESENVQDAIEELNNKMGTSSQMMTMEEYEELVDKKEGTFYFIYEE